MLKALARRWSAVKVDRAAISAVLERLDAHPPAVVMVHSSLSACGWIAGGPATVIEALRAWVGDGTLCMPTHTYCYPKSDAPAAVFDPASTPSVVGAITDRFWRSDGVYRSLHPTHSLAAAGPYASALIAGHEHCDTPCGRGTPYERLVARDAAVVMFGATMNSYTLYHTAEDAAKVPYLYRPQQVPLRYRDSAGEHSMLMWQQDMDVPRAFAERRSWLERRSLLTGAALGSGEVLYVRSAAAAHAALVDEMRRDPRFLLAA